MTRTFDVDQESEGQRLDRYLDERCPDLSRSRLQSLISLAHVVVDGAPGKPATRVRHGQVISLRVPPPEPTHIEPQALPLGIVYQDSDILVVDKPAGLTVGVGEGNSSSDATL